jgi:hypothetical protein
MWLLWNSHLNLSLGHMVGGISMVTTQRFQRTMPLLKRLFMPMRMMPIARMNIEIFK